MSESVYHLPYEPSSLRIVSELFGRERETEQIRQWYTAHESGVLLLHGVPGVGKTSTAEYIARQDQDRFSAIIWLNVKDEDTVKAGYVRLGQRLKRSHPDSFKPGTASTYNADELGQAAKAWLETPGNTRWLMVCDNFDASLPINDTANAYSYFMPDCFHGRYIVATRSTGSCIGHVVRLTKLEDLEAGLSILSEHSGRKDLQMDPHALKLAEELDGLPLALVSAGSYLRNSRMSFEKYLHHYRTSWSKLHKAHKGGPYERSLDCTFLISYELLVKQTPLAANLLVWWSYFDARDVWWELLHFAVSSKDKADWVLKLVEDELSFESVMQTLCDFGFVEAWAETPQSQQYSIHRCVHAWITATLSSPEAPMLAQLAVHCTVAHLYEKGDWSDHEMSRRVLQHAKHQVKFTLANIQDGLPALRAGKTLGTYFASMHRLIEADLLLSATLDAAGRLIGEDHPAFVYVNDELCNVCILRGQFEKADRCIARSLKWLAGIGLKDQDLLFSTLNHVMTLHNFQGHARIAEQVSRFMLALRTSVHGQDTKATILPLGHLAEALRGQGRHQECITIRRELVDLCTRFEGEDGKNTLMLMDELGQVLWETGQLEESEKLFNLVLERRRAKLGEDHPDTLCSLNSVAIMHGERDDPESQEALGRQAVNGLRATLGDADPLTQMCIHNLAGALVALGRDEEAEQLIREVLPSSIAVFGIEHVKTLTVIDNFVYTLYTLKRFEEAEVECQKGFDACQNAMKGQPYPPLEDLISVVKQQAGLRNRVRTAGIASNGAQPLSGLDVVFLNLSARLLALLFINGKSTERNKFAEDWISRSSKKRSRPTQDFDDRVRGTGGAIPTFASPEHF